MKIIELKKLNIIIDKHIINLLYHNNVSVDLDDSRKIYNLVIENINKDKNYGILTDLRDIKEMSKEARYFFANIVSDNIKANAVLIKSKFMSYLVSLYINIWKPPIKTRYFYTKAEAIAWLTGVLQTA